MRSRNPEKYDPLFWDVLEAVCEGKVIELRFDTEREAKGWRTNYYAFVTAVGQAYASGGKGLSERSRERLETRKEDYGLTAAMLVPGGIKVMLKAFTPQSQRLRQQFEESLARGSQVEVTEELAQASAEAMMRRLAEKGVVGEEGEEGELPPLGRPNPYY